MRLLACLLMFISLEAVSQNVISVSFAPAEMGKGLRYERTISEGGVYASYLQGQYKADNLTMDHKRISIGAIYDNITLGIVAHDYSNIKAAYTNRTLQKISFEVGGRRNIGRLYAGLRFDFIKGEGIWDIGFSF